MDEKRNNRKIIMSDIIRKERKPPPAVFSDAREKKAPLKSKRKFFDRKSGAFLKKLEKAGKIRPQNLLKQRSLKTYVRIAAVGVAILAFFLLVNVFSGVLIRIMPQEQFIEADALLKASGKAENNPAVLPLEVLRAEESKSKMLKAAGIEKIEKKASGKLKIFNAFSSQSQMLVAATRFETADGKIYRISDSVKVPGSSLEGNNLVPGSVSVVVFADQAGERYNIGLTDFTIPGFKGSSKYEKFYARSETEMTGGFVGEAPAVNQEDLQKAEDEIRTELKNSLLSSVRQKMPKDFLLYEEAADWTFSQETNLSKPNEKTKEFEIKLKGVLEAPLMKRFDLETALASAYFGKDNAAKLGVANLEDLAFNVISKNLKEPSLRFGLKGKTRFFWKIDEEILKRDLIAARPAGYKKVFENHSVIKKAEVVFRPSWWRIFPKKTSRIKIEIKLD